MEEGWRKDGRMEEGQSDGGGMKGGMEEGWRRDEGRDREGMEGWRRHGRIEEGMEGRRMYRG